MSFRHTKTGPLTRTYLETTDIGLVLWDYTLRLGHHRLTLNSLGKVIYYWRDDRDLRHFWPLPFVKRG